MLDTGLLLSGAVIVMAMWLAPQWVASTSRTSSSGVLDQLLAPAMAGLLAGRVVALVLDDPTSLRSLRAFLVIRGGVELWPGAIAAAATLVVGLRRAGEAVLPAVARLVPVALIGYAAFEATCLLREGCYGPHSAVGLRPDGIGATMLPLGVIAGAVLAGVAVVLARRPADPPIVTIASATLAVAAVRSIESVWLPRIGDGLTRPHWESIAVTVLAGVALLALRREPSAAR